MTDTQIKDQAAHEAAAAVADYEHGWSSDIETEFAPEGLERGHGPLHLRQEE
jgi:Fe-S cluster assembly protein SufB